MIIMMLTSLVILLQLNWFYTSNSKRTDQVDANKKLLEISTAINTLSPATIRTERVNKIRKSTVAFVTYELYPVTTYGGGAGVIVNGLVIELLNSGHNVVVVADCPIELLKQWEP